MTDVVLGDFEASLSPGARRHKQDIERALGIMGEILAFTLADKTASMQKRLHVLGNLVYIADMKVFYDQEAAAAQGFVMKPGKVLRRNIEHSLASSALDSDRVSSFAYERLSNLAIRQYLRGDHIPVDAPEHPIRENEDRLISEALALAN